MKTDVIKETCRCLGELATEANRRIDSAKGDIEKQDRILALVAELRDLVCNEEDDEDDGDVRPA